jgi:hypothetical protein
LFEGGKPTPREHFTLGYDEYVWTRDDRYVMVSRNDGSGAMLYDLTTDQSMDRDVAGEHPDVVRRMFEGYVLEDAGGPLPRY